jgi:hypothetical protein
MPWDIKEKALGLYQKHDADFGSTLATEMLLERHDILLGKGTRRLGWVTGRFDSYHRGRKISELRSDFEPADQGRRPCEAGAEREETHPACGGSSVATASIVAKRKRGPPPDPSKLPRRFRKTGHFYFSVTEIK